LKTPINTNRFQNTKAAIEVTLNILLPTSITAALLMKNHVKEAPKKNRIKQPIVMIIIVSLKATQTLFSARLICFAPRFCPIIEASALLIPLQAS